MFRHEPWSITCMNDFMSRPQLFWSTFNAGVKWSTGCRRYPHCCLKINGPFILKQWKRRGSHPCCKYSIPTGIITTFLIHEAPQILWPTNLSWDLIKWYCRITKCAKFSKHEREQKKQQQQKSNPPTGHCSISKVSPNTHLLLPISCLAGHF